MLTCICPGMSAANHTLNSLRYAERLKEKGQGGQGAPGSRGYKPQSHERTSEELRLFMEKHGKSLSNQANNRELADEPMDGDPRQDGLHNMFYQDERLDELMDDGEQDLLLNDEQNELLMQHEMEDDIAVMQNNKLLAKKSPNTVANNSRKGGNAGQNSQGNRG